MSAIEIVEGAARDGIRSLVLSGLRLRGDLTGQLMATTVRDDPYPMYRRLRELGPVVQTSMGPVTADHAVCAAVLRDPASRTGTTMGSEVAGGSNRFQQWLFSAPSRDGLIQPIGPESMIGMNPPDHTRLRRLVSGAFTPRRIERLRPRLTEIAQRLVHTARQQPSFDLMTDFAGVFPVLAICELLDIAEPDHEQFRRWGSALAADLDAMAPARRQREATRALRALDGYFTTLLAERRANPGEDLVSGLIAVEEEGDRLNSRELLATCILLLFAGFETTVNLIGNGTLALTQHRDQLDLLRNDRSLIPAAVEELLRYDPSIQVTARIPDHDLDIAGVRVPADQPISIMLGGANRDPAVFDHPEELDVTRTDARRHLSFAAGPHHCLGASLARMEAEIAFGTLLDQLGDLRLAGEPKRRPTFVLRGLTSLPLQANPVRLP
jgi:cytochrome P450